MLKQSAIRVINQNVRCKNRLALALDRSVDTVERWLTTNDVILTTVVALQIIEEETGLKQSDILEAAKVL